MERGLHEVQELLDCMRTPKIQKMVDRVYSKNLGIGVFFGWGTAFRFRLRDRRHEGSLG